MAALSPLCNGPMNERAGEMSLFRNCKHFVFTIIPGFISIFNLNSAVHAYQYIVTLV